MKTMEEGKSAQTAKIVEVLYKVDALDANYLEKQEETVKDLNGARILRSENHRALRDLNL